MNTLSRNIAVRVSEDDLDKVDKFCELHLLDRSGLIRSIIQGLDVGEKSNKAEIKKRTALLSQH